MLHLFQVVVDPTPSTPWWLALLTPIIPILTGYLSKIIFDGLKQIIAKLDTSSSFVKLAASTLVSVIVGFVTAHLALATPLGLDVHGWTADTISGILTALAAAGIYRLEKNKQLAAQGSATLEQQAQGVQPQRVHL